MMAGLGIGLVAFATMLATAPATADVKSGVDAWTRGDYPRAVAEWRSLAVAGDADAQFNLGQAYKLGRGVPVDPATAQSWFAKAAAQGHAQAQDNYGLALFQDGKKAEAAPWLEKAVDRDERRAELVLGTMLFNGDGVPKNWVRAYALVTRSAQQGLAQASTTLAQLDLYVPPEQRREGAVIAGQMVSAADTQPTRITAFPTAQNYTGKSGKAASKTARPETATVPSVRVERHATVAKAPKAAVKPIRAGPGGAWRVQLGAFRESGAGQTLWRRIGGRVGGTPAFVRTGAITRLQAAGFGSRAEAARACDAAKAIGTVCVVMAP